MITFYTSIRHGFLLCLSLAICSMSHAGPYREDFDIDDDGLIEIYDWTDLDDIRRNLVTFEEFHQSRKLYGVNDGCPESGCIGYELEADFDFDTNGNGVFDEGDKFYNQGKGWMPIGKADNLPEGVYPRYYGVFEGNGHTLSNLVIRRNGTKNGFFRAVRNSVIRNLKFENVEISPEWGSIGIDGDMYSSGALAGEAVNAKVYNVEVSGELTAQATSGLLLGIVLPSFDEALTADMLVFEAIGNRVSGKLVCDTTCAGMIGFVYNYTEEPFRPVIQGNFSDVQAEYIYDSEIDLISSAALTNLYIAYDEGEDPLKSSKRLDASGISKNLAVSEVSEILGINAINSMVGGDAAVDSNIHGIQQNNYWYSSSPVPPEQDLFTYHVNTNIDGLKCATANSGQFECSTTEPNVVMYENWDQPIEFTNAGEAEKAYWWFGAKDELPFIRFNEKEPLAPIDDLADADGDGLIEIHSLKDLHSIRFDLAGTSYRGATGGCPTSGCYGYELESDLDFDSNENGKFDKGDSYWNGGKGWQPLGKKARKPFTAVFKGNGHTISNLNVLRLGKRPAGLFSVLSGATVSDLVLVNAKVEGKNLSGAIAGRAKRGTKIHQVSVTAKLKSQNISGGIVGLMTGGGDVEAVHFSGRVKAKNVAGGIVGKARESIEVDGTVSKITLKAKRKGRIVGMTVK